DSRHVAAIADEADPRWAHRVPQGRPPPPRAGGGDPGVPRPPTRARRGDPHCAGRARQSGRATRLTPSVTLADANVLIPRTLRDYVVYAAKAGAIELHWSQPILDEMSRNLIAKFGFTAADAAELELRLTEYLPLALIEVRRRDAQLVAEVEMDAKDRHVVAAALSARATMLVTENTRHFPIERL